MPRSKKFKQNKSKKVQGFLNVKMPYQVGWSDEKIIASLKRANSRQAYEIASLKISNEVHKQTIRQLEKKLVKAKKNK